MSGAATLARSASEPGNPGLDLLDALVTASVDGIVVLDAYRRFVFANPAACELLGQSLDELLGRDFVMVIPERERQSALAEFAKSAHSNPERRQGMVCRPDGSLLDIEFTTTVLESQGRQLIAAILRDVSERRRQAREAAALAQAAASVAVCDSIDATVQALAECGLIGTGALGASVILDDRTDAGFWIGAAGLPDGFREAMRAATRARASMAALAASMTQRVVVYADARRQLERDSGLAGLSDVLKRLPWQAGLFAPVVYRRANVGYLTAIYRQDQLPTEAETIFLATLADQAAMAAANARLVAVARERIVLEERQRLARELHDSVSQALCGIELGARMARERLIGDPAGVAQLIDHVLQLADAGEAEMRALIFELRPESLETEGLVVALNKQIEALRARHGISVRAVNGKEPELPLEVKEALYRIAQEALHNTVKHARAEHVEVRLEADEGRLVLEIADDGVGFDPERSFPGHLGLRSMRERALGVGGSVEVVSAPDRGTRVVASVRLTTEPQAGVGRTFGSSGCDVRRRGGVREGRHVAAPKEDRQHNGSARQQDGRGDRPATGSNQAHANQWNELLGRAGAGDDAGR
jgi:PAS domain S-box-containing protein